MRRLTALAWPFDSIVVSLVFAHHVDQHAMPGGFIGVDIFFVISGYAIAALLLRERARRQVTSACPGSTCGEYSGCIPRCS